MARDYGQRSGNGKRRAQTKQKPALPSWIWLVFGLSVGLAVAAFVYISRPAEPMPSVADESASEVTETAPEKSKAKPPKPKASTKPGPKNNLPLPPEEEERFTFYKDLKKQRVPVIPRDERPPKATPKPAAAASEDLFLIQVASYRAVSDAENQRASLALLGIESRIEKVTVDDKDVYFRVRSGPVNKAKAEVLVARLHDNGIEAIVLKAN